MSAPFDIHVRFQMGAYISREVQLTRSPGSRHTFAWEVFPSQVSKGLTSHKPLFFLCRGEMHARTDYLRVRRDYMHAHNKLRGGAAGGGGGDGARGGVSTGGQGITAPGPAARYGTRSG